MIQILSIVLICFISIGIFFTLLIFIVNLYLRNNTLIEPVVTAPDKAINLSIHIPTRAEPFEVVKNCLDAILHQKGDNDEIIVIDNNHSNQNDYLPLKAYCELHHIHFEHYDYIKGYKAGALNQAYKATAEKSNYILIVDCDYIIEPNALRDIKNLVSQYSQFGFLQFPQAYFVENKIDVNNELTKYFTYNLAFNKNDSLGTGTMCCIKKSSLERIGLWPTKSITEDALFGLKIQEIGEKGLYIPKIVGRGYLPTTIKDFYNQRKRWIYGNAEVLFDMLKSYSWNNIRLRNISQLTTWLNFAAITILIHILLIIMALFGVDITKVLMVVYVHYIIILLTKLYEFSQLPLSLSRCFKAFLIQWQSLIIGSFHWLPVLLNKSKEFVRTPKLVGLNKSLVGTPILFLVINIVTLIVSWQYTPLGLVSILFIIIELLSIKTLTSNFK